MATAKRDVHLVTEDGLKKLKEELEYRSTVKKEEIKNTIEEMRNLGDLRENDGYTLALQDFESNNIEIERLTDMIKNAKVVKGKKDGKIQIGETVILKDGDGKQVEYQLVGENDTDPLNGKISHVSPLGSSIVGKKKGDKFTFTTPRGEVNYTIIEVKG